MRMSQALWIGCLAVLLPAQASCAEPAVDGKATEAKPAEVKPAEAKPTEAKPTDKAMRADKPTIDLSAGIPVGEPRPGVLRIEKALDEKTELEFSETPLKEVIDFLKKKHDIEIQIDWKALMNAGTSEIMPVNCKVKNVPLRSALLVMLRGSDLAYEVHDDILLITTQERADAVLQTRLYPVRDLLDDTTPGTSGLNPASDLIATITETISPTTWDEVGGPGSIKYLTVAGCLIVSQSSEIHQQIRDLLIGIRKILALSLPPLKDKAANVNPNDLFLVVYPLDRSVDAYRVATEPNPPDNKAEKPTGNDPLLLPTRTITLTKRPLTDELARVIPKVVDPATWQAGGGQGSIESVGIGLAVRQTRGVHLQVAAFLKTLEKVKKSPTYGGGGGGGFFQVAPQ